MKFDLFLRSSTFSSIAKWGVAFCATLPALYAANDVAAGFRQSLTILDGTSGDDGLWGWGQNNFGQAGDSSLGALVTTAERLSTATWDALAAGTEHAVALQGGVIYVVGNNTSGQLGLPVPDPVGGFTLLSNGGFANSGFTAVAAGDFHTLALKGGTGELWAFGSDIAGQLGNSDNLSASSSTPVQVIAPEGQWVSVAAGGNQSFGITSTGKLFAWGSNIEGQLGIGDRNTLLKLMPEQVGTATDWAFVETGQSHTLAINNAGDLYAWGRNREGQLGTGSVLTSVVAPQLVDNVNDWEKVDAGRLSSLGITTDGKLWAWGQNRDGQLGLGTTDNQRTPLQVPGFAATLDFVDVAAGSEHSVVLALDLANGNAPRVFVAGSNDFGQLADPELDNDLSDAPDSAVFVEVDFEVAAQQATDPDFAIASFSLDSGQNDPFSLTQEIDLTILINNVGAAYSNAASATLDIYLSADNSLATTGDNVILTVPSIDLGTSVASGQTLVVNTTVSIPSGLSQGEYFFIADVNVPLQVVEGSTANNTRATAESFTIQPKPDFVLTADSLSLDLGGAEPVPGLAVNLTVPINNAGGSFGNDLAIDVRLSRDKIFSNEDISLLSGTLPAFAGSTSTQVIPLTLPGTLERGDYFFVVRVNGDASIPEDDTSHNTSSTASATTFLADIVATSVIFSLPDSEPQPGDSFDVTLSLTNLGATVSPLTDGVFLFADVGLEGSDSGVTALGTLNITNSIARGQTVEVTGTFTIPTDIDIDRYSVRAVVDPGTPGNVDEIEDITNNTVLSANTIDLLPDFQISNFVIPAVDIVPGGNIGFKGTGINVGTSYNGGQTAADSVRIDVALSLDTSFNPSSDILLTNTIDNGAFTPLLNGKSFSDSVSFGVPAEVPAGIYYVVAKIDPDAVILESNEANNEFVSVQTFALLADVEVDALSLVYNQIANSYARGELFEVDFSVINSSEFAVRESQPIVTEVRLSQNRVWGDLDDILISDFVPSLVAPAAFLNGASVAASAQGAIPDNAPPGNYFVAIRVDNDDSILESNDTNNTFFSSSANVAITGPDLGDSLEETLPAPSSSPPAFGEQRDYEVLLGGASSWYAQGDNTNGSANAARSGPVADGQASIMSLQFYEPERFDFNFDWAVSSEESFDFLVLRINNEEVAAISGNSGWQSYTRTLEAGLYTIDFIYRKDASESKNLDAGFVDNVLISAPVDTGIQDPDFIIVDAQSTPGTLIVQRDAIDFNVVGTNIGADLKPDTNPLIVSAVLSTDRDFGNGDDIVLGDVRINELLDENDQFIYRRIVELPETTRSGLPLPDSERYYLGFRVDPPYEDSNNNFVQQGYFVELNENNNIYWTASNDYVVETRPDISLENFDYEAGRFSYGDKIQLSFDLVNRGLRAIPSFLNGGPAIDFEIRLSAGEASNVIANFQFSQGLEIGESRFIQLSVDVPEGLEISTECGVLNVFANTTDVIEESRTVNNSTLNTLLDSAVTGYDIGEAIDLPELRWERTGNYCRFWTGQDGAEALDELDVVASPETIEVGDFSTIRASYFAEQTTVFSFAASGEIFFRLLRDGGVYSETLITTPNGVYEGHSVVLEAGSFYDLEFVAGTVLLALGVFDAEGNFLEPDTTYDATQSGLIDRASLFLPDITIDEFEIATPGPGLSQQLDRGDDIDLDAGSLLISNRGDLDIPPNTPLVFAFYLTRDRVIGNGDDYLIRNNVLGFLRDTHTIKLDQSLVSGDPGPPIQVIDDFRLTIPDYAEPGFYKLAVVANADGSISELGELSNTFFTATNVVEVRDVSSGGNAITLNEALDNAVLSFSGASNVPLFGFQSTDPLLAQDGVDAVRSDFINEGSSTSLTTSVSGPAELSFYWRSDTLGILNSFNLFQDDVLQRRISGLTIDEATQAPTWERVRIPLNEGTNNIEWRYIKGKNHGGNDVVFLDQVSVDYFDLTGDTVAYAGGQVLERGDSLTLDTLQIRNDGTTTLPADYAVTFEIILSQNTVVGDSDDIFVERRSILSDVSGGGLYTLSNVAVTIPPYANPGIYYVGVNLDDGLTLSETNEGNNGFLNLATTIEVDTLNTPTFLEGVELDGIPLTFRQTGDASWFGTTDLPAAYSTAVGGDLGQSPTLEKEGQSAVFEIEVQGPVDISFDWLIVSANDSLIFSEFDTEDSPIATISNNTVSKASVSYFVPAGNSPITLRWTYLRGSTLAQDPDAAAWVDNIVITPETRPDLAIVSLDVTGGEYILDVDPRDADGADLDKIPVTVEVVNQGAGLPPGALIGTSDVELRLSANRIWGDSDDVLLGNFARTESMDAANGILFTGPVPINLDIPEGAYYMGVRVDIYDAVNERNEVNNTLFTQEKNVQITRLPDLNLDYNIFDNERIFYPESELRGELLIKNIGLDDVSDELNNRILIELYQITKADFASAFEQPTVDAYDQALLGGGTLISQQSFTLNEFIQGRTNNPPNGSELVYELAYTLPTAAELGFFGRSDEENRAFYYFLNVTVDADGAIRESSERNRAIPGRRQVFNTAFNIVPVPGSLTATDYHRQYFADLDALRITANNLANQAGIVETQVTAIADLSNSITTDGPGAGSVANSVLAESANTLSQEAAAEFATLSAAVEASIDGVQAIVSYLQSSFANGAVLIGNISTALNTLEARLPLLDTGIPNASDAGAQAAESAANAATDAADQPQAQADELAARDAVASIATIIDDVENALADIETNLNALIADSFDLDGDGFTNFIEYALYLNPFAAENFSIASLPAGNAGDGVIPSSTLTDFFGLVTVDGREYLRLTFNAQTAATDIRYTVQVRDVPSGNWLDHYLIEPPFAVDDLSGVGGLLSTDSDKLAAAVFLGGTVRFTVKDDVPIDEIPDTSRIFRLQITDTGP